MVVKILIRQAIQSRVDPLLVIVLFLVVVQSPGSPRSNMWYLISLVKVENDMGSNFFKTLLS